MQHRDELNRKAGRGVAVREFPLPAAEADYLLFVDGRAAGVIEAKKATLSGFAEQSEKYLAQLPEHLDSWADPLPFGYESTGIETLFRDLRDPKPRSRPVLGFHQPETIAEWLAQPATLRRRLQQMPPLITQGLRGCQIEAIANLERSLAADHPRSLIQMATGSGKTFTACNFSYRLIKHAGARRILFLVDRNNLGDQTLREFQAFTTPDDGRNFTALYNVQHLQSNRIDPVAKVCITTIQRLYSMLRGEEDYDPAAEEVSTFETALGAGERERPVAYNPKIPIETFDVVVTDECHRSIYKVWRQVLEYFDSHIIGLTATPSRLTLGFFGNNLVMTYPYERSVADGVNVGYEIYRIKTKVSEEGSRVEAGYALGYRDRRTRMKRWEELDRDFEYIYDFRTNQSFTLKQRPLRREDLDDFVGCYRPGNRQAREESERFRAFTYDELIARDKANLDIFWLKDESLEDADGLPEPAVLAAEIIENLEAALEQFREVALALGSEEVALRSEEASLGSD